MAAVWICKPAACCYGTDRTGCILKDDGKNRMDTLHTDVCDVSSCITALVQKTIALAANIAAHNATFLVDGLQLIVALLLMILGVLVAYSCLKKLFTTTKNSEQK